MLLKQEIESATEDALARVYAIVDRVLELKYDLRYMPDQGDIHLLTELKEKLAASSELIQLTCVYLEHRMKNNLS